MTLLVLFRRISNAWLLSKTASILFAVSSVLAVAFTPVLWGYVSFPVNPGQWENLFEGVVGVAGALSMVLIWGGMWHYWAQCDSSRRSVKRISFMVLLLGFWYGAILYYLLIYLPTESPKHKRRNAEEEK